MLIVDLELSLKDLLYKKTLIMKQLEGKFSPENILKIKGDYHTRKPPRPCGLTVHSVVGCKYNCTYCYLPDMGVSPTTYLPYGLNGDEMTYALLSNPAFLPGRLGTLIAIGSLGEPFADNAAFLKTLEYLHSFSRYLGNPTQFSTKSVLSETQVKALASVKLPISPLVTLVTLTYTKQLEPNAPSPYERLKTIKLMRRHGLHPILFLRPIIPGVNTNEFDEILTEAKRHGAVGVVFGGLRVTPLILERLEKTGINTTTIRERIRGTLRKNVQTHLELSDFKKQGIQIAREKGLIPFLSACCANNYTAMLYDGLRAPCPGLDYIDGRFCTLCPVQCPSIKTKVDVDEVREMLGKITLTRVYEVSVDEKFIRARLGKKNLSAKERALLEVGYRRKVVLA